MSEAADSLGYFALAGWDVEQSLAGLEPTLNLAAATGMDLALTADIVTDSMSMFAMKADEAERMADVLAKTSSSTNTDVTQLGEALVYVGANAHASGMDIETTSSVLGLLADNGLKSSKAGTTLNAILRDMKASAEDGAIAIGDTNVALYDSQGNMRDMTDVIDDVIKATNGLTDEQRDLALSQIFGQEAIKGVNILLNEGAGATKELREELYDATGTSKDMADTLEGGIGGSLRSLKSAIEGLFIAFGETLAPMIAKFADKITEVTRKFASLDDRSKKVIITIAGIAAAIGPLLLIGGKLFVGISSLITAFTTISGVVASAGGAIGLLTNPIGWVIAAIGVLIATGVAWHKNFEKIEEKLGTTATVILGLLNPLTTISTAIKLFQRANSDAIDEVDRFGDEVSDKTKEVLGSYFELADGTQVALNEMAWSQDKVTKKSAKQMVKNYEEMNEQIISGLKERHAEEVEEANEQFKVLDGLSDKRQAEILQQLDEHHNKEIEAQQKRNDRIKEIFENASKEKRAITQTEYDEITRLNDEMNEQAVRALSENEIESAIILERMKAQATDLTSRQAAEVVKNSKEATDGAIEEAERQYDETIAWIVRQRDETGTISAEEADELIRQAERQRDESIKSAEERHEGIIKQAQLQAEEHINLIDWETGEILTKWEVFKNNLADKLAEIERNVGDTFQNVMQTILEKMGMSEKGALEHAEAMRLGAGEAWRILTGQTDMSFSEIYGYIKDRMTEARDIVDKRLEQVKKYFAELKLKFPEISMEFIEKAKEKAKGIADDIKGFFNNMVLKIPTPQLPKMPTLRIPSVVTNAVKWNAKGAIFNKPTIFDTPAGLQGVGEKGSEVVMPLYGKEMKPFADAITSGLMTNFKELNRQYDYETPSNSTETNYNYSINLNVDRLSGTKDDARMVLSEIVKGVKRKGGRI